MSSLAFLVTELQSLASETRRKHPDVREAAEKSLGILRSSPEQATANLASGMCFTRPKWPQDSKQSGHIAVVVRLHPHTFLHPTGSIRFRQTFPVYSTDLSNSTEN
ncbi:hypothetical protein C8Q79DRAFT_978810 [Trametes meyenii]|nr:hypothetical protein C8Q79DRAFT_978810 [Trametes meyenii]